MDVRYRRLSDAIGAEILGVDIARPLDAKTTAEIRRIWLEHNIVLFRDAPLAPEQQIHFARHFGEIELHTLSKYHMPGRPEIFINSNVVENGRPIGAQKSGRAWHSDSQFLAVPSSATLLHAVEAPPDQGDTQYANMYAAYEALPDAMRRRIDGLHGIYSRAKSWAIDYPHRPPLTEEQRAALPDATHPIVRIHPETGRRALYVGALSELVRVAELAQDESDDLATQLHDFAVSAPFVYTHRWRVGDTIVWDNRCTMHRALPFDEDRHRRVMHRVTIQGTPP